MIHNDLNAGGHWGVNTSHNNQFVLVQLQDQYGDQVRVAMLPNEAARLRNRIDDLLDDMEDSIEKPDSKI
jgi:hypothetical protein